MKIDDFFDNLNSFFTEDEYVEDPDMLDQNAQIYAYAYKNENGDIYEIRIFNPEYREMMVIDKKGNVKPMSLTEYES